MSSSGTRLEIIDYGPGSIDTVERVFRGCMILTWKLWRTLREPPPVERALYKRSVSQQPLPIRLTINQRILWLLAALVLIYIVSKHGVLSLLIMLFAVPALGVLSFVMLPVMLPILTTIVGGFWAASISGSVVKERHRHTYDLLCLAPEGSLGANWALAIGCLHRGDAFGVLRFGVYLSLLIGAVFLGIVAFVVLFLAVRTTSEQSMVIAARVMTDLAALLLLFWVHYLQSMVLSVLVGIYVPARFGGLMDAFWLAFGLFEALQIGTYLLFALAQAVLEPLLSMIVPEMGLIYVGLPLIKLVLFAALREGMILWLWQAVARRLTADSAERDVLMRSFEWP